MALPDWIPRRGGKRWGFWVPVSLAIHAAALLPFVQFLDEPPTRVGSDAVIVDLVQPRLAAPRVSRRLGKQPRGMDAPRRQGQRAARAVTLNGARLTSATGLERSSRSAARRRKARPTSSSRVVAAAAATAVAVAGAARSHDGHTPVIVTRRHDSSSAVVSRKRRETLSAAERRVLAAMASFQPAAAVPLALARRAARHLRATRERQARSVAALRAGQRRAERALARLTAIAHAAARRGDFRARHGESFGASDRVGLSFYLSGRRVLSGKIVVPPQPRYLPPTTCHVDRLGIPPATVRMLVGREGGVPVAYIKHSSGDRGFDRCALKHARGMRFRPGRDASGTPLDVWIHLRIAPSLRSASLAAAL